MIVKVKIKTGAREQNIEKINKNEYKVSLNSRPVKGEANRELLKLLKNYFGKTAEIVSGSTSRVKIIKLE